MSISWNPSLDFSWGTWGVVIILLCCAVLLGMRKRMKDISISLWTTHELDDDELQKQLGEFLDGIRDVDQYEIVIDNVSEPT